MPSRRAGLAVSLVAALVPLAPTSAAEPRPLQAWRVPGPELPAPERPDPIELELGPSPVDGRLVDLARRGLWAEVADALAAMCENPSLSGVLVPSREPLAGLVGAREEARRRLMRLPPPALEAYRAHAEPHAAALLATPGWRREAALRDVLARFGATSASRIAARHLGEVHLERGDVAGALLLWRLALRDAPASTVDPALEARVLALRAALGPGQAGSLGLAGYAPDGAWAVTWARRVPPDEGERAVASDESAVYVADRAGVQAVDRRDGRLRWRAPLGGGCRRLAVRADLVLALFDARLVALAAEDGSARWTHAFGEDAPEDRFVDAVVTPGGVVALASVGAERCLLGLDPRGRVAFETRLWRAAEQPVACPREARLPPEAELGRIRPLLRRLDGPPDLRPGEELLSYLSGRVRPVAGDGRLAVLGDRVVVTADGFVVAASLSHGGILWARDRLVGLEVAGDRVLVTLTASPYAVEAVTAAGTLVRLDPLDGRSLPLPVVPETAEDAERLGLARASPRTRRTDPACYVLATSPLVLGYAAEDGFQVVLGVPPRPLVRLAQGPLGPGVVRGRALSLPDVEGVAVFDLSTGAEVGFCEWPLGPGALRATGDGVLAVSEGGAAHVAPGASGPPGAADAAPTDAAGWVERLGSPDWRVRLRAEDELARRGDEALAALRRASDEAGTLEARDRAAHLMARVERRRVFRELAPNAPASLVEDLAQGVRVEEGLSRLWLLVPTGDEGHAGLLDMVRRSAEDPGVRVGLTRILLRIDGRARDGLVAVLVDADQPDGVRSASAEALVDLVCTGGPGGAFERIFAPDVAPEARGFVFEAAARQGDRGGARTIVERILNQDGHRLVFRGLMPSPDPAPLVDALLERLDRR